MIIDGIKKNLIMKISLWIGATLLWLQNSECQRCINTYGMELKKLFDARNDVKTILGIA